MNWKKLIATGFGTGYLPIGPGSWGTFPGMLLCWAMQPLHPMLYLWLILLGAWASVHLVTAVEPEFGRKDPGEIVIDEIIAFPLTMFLIPLSAGTLLLGFLLNRLMDTMKLWPCDGLQRLPGGWGVMMDDMVAAVQSCLLMHLAIHLWPQLKAFHAI